MAQDSTQMIARTGGETKVTSLFGNLMNQLTNSENTLSVQDLTTKILNTYGGEQRQVSPAKYDYIYGIFQKEVESEQLAKAYTLLVIDSIKTLNLTVDQLFESTSDPIKFTNLILLFFLLIIFLFFINALELALVSFSFSKFS